MDMQEKQCDQKNDNQVDPMNLDDQKCSEGSSETAYEMSQDNSRIILQETCTTCETYQHPVGDQQHSTSHSEIFTDTNTTDPINRSERTTEHNHNDASGNPQTIPVRMEEQKPLDDSPETKAEEVSLTGDKSGNACKEHYSAVIKQSSTITDKQQVSVIGQSIKDETLSSTDDRQLKSVDRLATPKDTNMADKRLDVQTMSMDTDEQNKLELADELYSPSNDQQQNINPTNSGAEQSSGYIFFYKTTSIRSCIFQIRKEEDSSNAHQSANIFCLSR